MGSPKKEGSLTVEPANTFQKQKKREESSRSKIGRKQKKKKVPDQRSKANKRKKKVPDQRSEENIGKKKIPDQRSEENENIIQKGLRTRQISKQYGIVTTK